LNENTLSFTQDQVGGAYGVSSQSTSNKEDMNSCECVDTHTHTIYLSPSLTHSPKLSPFHTLTRSTSLTHTVSLSHTHFPFLTLTHPNALPLTLSPSHTHTHTPVLKPVLRLVRSVVRMNHQTVQQETHKTRNFIKQRMKTSRKINKWRFSCSMFISIHGNQVG